MTRPKLISLARTCGAVIAVTVLVITFTPLVRVVAEMLATDWYEGDADILVVLGGSMLIAGTGPNATLGYDSYLRTVYAGWYLKAHSSTMVVVSGADGVAEGMAKYLTASGVSPSSILLESRSHSTYENAVYTKALLQQHSLVSQNSRIAILTSDYHSWRARRVFERCGLRVRAIPVPDVTKRSASYAYRLAGLFTILTEFAKDLVYFWQHKI